jgi:hypothetical protein
VEVTLTFEADGEYRAVSATADTYEIALAEARKQIPEGNKAIVIRTDNY